MHVSAKSQVQEYLRHGHNLICENIFLISVENAPISDESA